MIKIFKQSRNIYEEIYPVKKTVFFHFNLHKF